MPKVFAISDLHIDYDVNFNWLCGLSTSDFQEDALILAGDISDRPSLLHQCFNELGKRFKYVCYVPGNHDLWVIRDTHIGSSLSKFDFVSQMASDCGISMQPVDYGPVSIVPLLGWYDYSFGSPSAELRAMWMDYRACAWPNGLSDVDIARHFFEKNSAMQSPKNECVISFSHFLPRIDLMPSYIPQRHRFLYPVLGSSVLEQQVRQLGSNIHVYGHSHVNRHITIDGVSYVNNAFGSPSETHIAAKRIACLYEW